MLLKRAPAATVEDYADGRERDMLPSGSQNGASANGPNQVCNRPVCTR